MRAAVHTAKEQRERRARDRLRALLAKNPDWYHSPMVDMFAGTMGLVVTFSNGEKFTLSTWFESKDDD